MDTNTNDTSALTLEEKEESVSDAAPTPAISPEDLKLLNAMTEAGIHFGRKKSKTSPQMAYAIYTVRNNMAVIDVSKTLEALRAAGDFLRTIIARQGKVLVLGTQPALRDATLSFAKQFSFAVVVERWLGGTLTNFATMKGRIVHFKKLREDKAAGRLARYSKKEQLMIQREIDRLEKFFGGIETLDQLPDALFMIDVEMHETALREAKKLAKSIPVVGLLNTDGEHLRDVDYPVPMNTSGKSSVEWVLNFLADYIKEAKSADAAPSAATSI